MKLTFKLVAVIFVTTLFLTSCKDDKRYIAKEEAINYKISDSVDPITEIKAFQAELNKEYKNAKTSPLTQADRKNFKGLSFYPIDTVYRVTARFEETPFEPSFRMKTTTDRAPEYKRYGIAYFTLKGKEYQLNVYQSQELKLKEEYVNYLFIPFLDETNGSETYGGGRYIDSNIPDATTMIIDFNKAYNPYCSYNKRYSCPIVPDENRLTVLIEAGVKKFH
ncbi:hypothetical protein NBRC110019_29090 [Neptunitalea chrysea]|uniref:DUF1684 domain-containing protein n=1 Tax=Neptunitalea chrysea TaxID=1647581 RepID=A0A9W6B771_9FLAO|nr:DUF1684 domain-containing protein [Neptunitalea chrysea]GLB53868.1 hypothetical protein NBRC110019_29090 [Neptunitalea chrysea]